MKRRPVVAILALLLALSYGAPPASAVRPDEMLADPALELRAREIGKELRCLVCQNQSIDDSDADLAHDLRVLVRERLQAGDSDAGALAYIHARYGDFVLLRPPLRPATWVLWFGPAAAILAGGAGVVLFFRRRRRALPEDQPPLSDAERRRLAAVLDTDGEP